MHNAALLETLMSLIRASITQLLETLMSLTKASITQLLVLLPLPILLVKTSMPCTDAQIHYIPLEIKKSTIKPPLIHVIYIYIYV